MTPEAEPSDDQLLATFPQIPIDHDNRAHYAGYFARELHVARCTACGARHHPPHRRCPTCWSVDVSAPAVSGDGTIHLLIWLHQGPPALGVEYDPPHPVATVALDEQDGLRFTGTVTTVDRSLVRIGARVRLTWIERDGVPWPAFEVVEP